MARERDYKAEYERRIQLGKERGLTTGQSRGHPEVGLPPAREVLPPKAPPTGGSPPGGTPPGPRPPKPPPTPPPPRIPPPALPHEIAGPGGSRQINTSSLREIAREILKMSDKNISADRVYFGFWNKETGTVDYLYRGAKGKGMSVEHIAERMRDKIANGEAQTPREALLQVFEEDIADSGEGSDYDRLYELPGGGGPIPQVRMHVLPH